MSTVTTPATQPRVRSRIKALDVARGVAILGTLATNVWIFSHPGGLLGYINHPTSAGAPALQQGFERLFMALANGKFLGLLTLMFGIGLVIQAESAARRGARWPGRYPLRMGILLVEGLIHFVLIAEFDVLMGYAVTGVIVAFIVVRSPGVRRAWAIVTGLIHLTVVTLLTALLLAVPGGDLGQHPDERLYQDGSWWELVVMRLDNALVFRAEPILIGCLTFALFLIGAELYRAGVFDERGRALRSRLLVAGAIALVLDLTLALTLPATVLFSRYVLAPVVAMGLLALIALLAKDGGGALGALLTPVGRMALSCYIAQNLICAALFQGWGLGLNAVSPDARLWVTATAYGVVCLALVIAARWWLRRFDAGPVEWVAQKAFRTLAR
ncbi:DUF418 domain-containing protein [Ammonicoccus fulvus]|uniref:DUF418 domain-containing protein n=1 Tax=Ammonicoccus fulvus TaxID=3138240 RepID=A0ABZ3FKT3_9ACTN